ncbi:MAG TPA: sodium:solute symporter [Flavobacteriaceae bacterium]|jgi:Na+/proline symporter|nr:sodium:solute symporter [Flavobacteriaceae bacterium]
MLQAIDWWILLGTLVSIAVYGVYKTRGKNSADSYALTDHQTPWWTIGISVMATQASAITFLSTPGQAFADGMGFVQFYFGLPLAMMVIAFLFVPLFYKQKIQTAYEFLEKRFDRRMRLFTALLFLIQRGLAAGITLYAPAIILSTALGWPLKPLIWGIGLLVIFYTVSGGTQAVNVTQKQQMGVIFMGMGLAFGYIWHLLPEGIGWDQALLVADQNDKLTTIDFSLDPNNRYTFWSGITGGFFLALSYFGTDQSQVQRYISGKNIKESQWGLFFNALLKIPMQLFILFCGVMVYVFFQFTPQPINFNPEVINTVENSYYRDSLEQINIPYRVLQEKKKELYLTSLVDQTADLTQQTAQIIHINDSMAHLEEKMVDWSREIDPKTETNDKDFVFLHFILTYLPHGLIGLLIAVMLAAAMSSSAAELNALGTTTAVDWVETQVKKPLNEEKKVWVNKFSTAVWGLLAISFASWGSLFDNLIQLVNIIGSIFYGNILGIFLLAMLTKNIRGRAVFWAALATQIMVIYVYQAEWMSYLWLNLLGCVLVFSGAFILQWLFKLNSNLK